MNCISLLPPEQEPLRLDEAKLFLRVSTHIEDELILSLIQVARSHVEGVTKRALLKQKWRITLTPPYPKTFPLRVTGLNHLEIQLPLPPLINIETVKIFEREVPYEVQEQNLRLESGLFGKRIEIDFWAGYGDNPQLLPPPLKMGVLLSLKAFYEGNAPPEFAFLNPYKILSLI